MKTPAPATNGLTAAGSAGGENYGWRLMEGNACFNPSSNCDDGTLTHPILEYDHGLGCSITGGYVYRGSRFPRLTGIFEPDLDGINSQFLGNHIQLRIHRKAELGRSMPALRSTNRIIGIDGVTLIF